MYNKTAPNETTNMYKYEYYVKRYSHFVCAADDLQHRHSSVWGSVAGVTQTWKF